jgi:uncharacterized protein (TIGR02217 family)
MNSALFFPVLPGLAWQVRKKPRFSNEIMEATSGKKTSLLYWPNPKWAFALDFNYLRNTAKDGGYSELAKLLGLFLRCHGDGSTFLFDDPNDDLVRGQAIGTADGVATQFQLVRDFGGFAEPIQNADPATLSVYVEGVKAARSAWTLTATGFVEFAAPPGTIGEEKIVTADFRFYFLCRFLSPEQEFNNWIFQVYKAQSVKFESEPI